MKGSAKKELNTFNINASLNLGELLPITTTSSSSTTTLLPYSSCSNLHGLDNINGQISEQPSSRWNPTAEQLLALEEMYRSGTRTPSADQIQQIASQLRRFGKIEGKNVFYWFQNHKARERQKRRREADCTTTLKFPNAGIDNRDSGSFQLQQKKTLLSSNLSSENLEATVDPLHKAESTITNNAWAEKNYTWHDLNNSNITKTTSSIRSLNFEENQINAAAMLKHKNKNLEVEEVDEIETLELFPLCKSSREDSKIGIGIGINGRTRKKLNDGKVPTRPINTNQYFEFLKENRN